MAKRRIFTPKSEILAQSFNRLRNDYETLVLTDFLGKSVPRIPAFIGSSMQPKVSGNQVVVSAGIGLQRIAQTDGSSPVRLILLSADSTQSFTLPAAGQQKTDLIQVRSKLTNDPTENRNIKVGASVVDRATVVSNRWDAEVSVKAGVTPDAEGNYDADLGWVPVAVVHLNSTGITSMEDARDFYNLFDPDFFSVYGRKNVTLTRPYDGVNLIEVPFEFSDLVTKLQQVSVRRITKERFGASVTAQGFTSPNFTLSAPAASVSSVNKQTFIGAAAKEVTMSSQNIRGTSFELTGGTQEWTNYSRASSRNNWDDGFTVSFDSGSRLNWLFIDDIDRLDGLIPDRTIYLLFWNSRSGVPSTSNAVVYAVNYGASVVETFTANQITPTFKSSDITTSFNRCIVSTVNPISQSSQGSTNYTLSSPVSIPRFHQLSAFSYATALRRLKFSLKDLTAGTTAFPAQGRVFNSVKIKKGTETRLSLNYSDFTVNLPTTTTGGGGQQARTPQVSRNIALGAVGQPNSAWTSGVSDGTTVWFVIASGNIPSTGIPNRARAYVAATGARDASKDINLGVGPSYFSGGVSDGTTLWFVDSNSGFARAYVAATRARDSAKDINLGSSGFVYNGGVSDGTTLWFISFRHRAWVAQAYVAATRARDTAKDINLGTSGFSYGTSDGTTLWFVQNPSNRAIAYVAATRARDAAKDISLGTADWGGAVRAGNIMWFLNSTTNTAVAYSLVTSGGTPIVTRGDTAEYTYNLTSLDQLIKSGDSTFADFTMEFDRRVFQGEEIWRANSLRGGSVLSPTVDFKIEEEGLRTYVRLNDQYPFKSGDQLIFSHVIPQELIDAGSGGTPEEQTAAAQIAALRTALDALTRRVGENEGDISTLENQTAASDITFYYGIAAIPGGRTSGARTNAKSTSYLTPVVQAAMSNPASRTAKTVRSLLLSGSLVLYNSGQAAGYFTPWIAVEKSDIGSTTLTMLGSGGAETTLWSPVGEVTVNSKVYSLYARTSPIINGRRIWVVFKSYE